MKVTIKKLRALGACEAGIDWFLAQKKTELSQVLFALLDDDKADWANWLIVRYMTKAQKIRYAIYAAKQVLDIFEKKHPDGKRPRKAIEAAEVCLKSPTAKNRSTADAAVGAVDAAACAAVCAASAAVCAASAAACAVVDVAVCAVVDVAVCAIACAAVDAAACATAYTAAYAAACTVDAAAGERRALQIKIIKYGIALLRKGK